jgi:hypothetical protein
VLFLLKGWDLEVFRVKRRFGLGEKGHGKGEKHFLVFSAGLRV